MLMLNIQEPPFGIGRSFGGAYLTACWAEAAFACEMNSVLAAALIADKLREPALVGTAAQSLFNIGACRLENVRRQLALSQNLCSRPMVPKDGLQDAVVVHINNIGRSTLKMSYIFLRLN
jgi:hypothetical protein